jgi:prevent-host-death family protein
MTIVMKTQTIAAGEFKAKCLRLMDEVQQRNKEIIVTKRGKPVAKLVPVKPERRDPFFGRLAGTAKTLGDIINLDVPWDAAR